MAKRKSESSRQENPAKKRKKPTSKIDFSDIPETSDAQLACLRRVGRPTLGESVRQLIAIRIDPGVLFALQQEAQKNDVGYQTLINDILAKYVRKAS